MNDRGLTHTNTNVRQFPRDAGFLAPDEPAAVEVIGEDAMVPLIITVDHGGNRVPRALNDLGLPRGELERHIAWDIGAAGVSRRLARNLGATAVLATYSRLLIDPNRPLGDPEAIPAMSDGTFIPGNQNLTKEDIRRRIELLYEPYHRAVDAQIARLRRTGIGPAILAVHSCTPALTVGGRPRPWHVGIMYSYDDRLARFLRRMFEVRKELIVGDNEPYSGLLHGYAQKRHGLSQSLPHAQLEIRQDLIGTEVGQETWAAMCAEILQVWLKR